MFHFLFIASVFVVVVICCLLDMISFFISDQALSAQNKAIQAKVTTYQTSGTKSFARRIEEEVI